MGKTKIHISKAKFKNGIINFNNCDISFKLWCNRKNRDLGYFRMFRNYKKLKND